MTESDFVFFSINIPREKIAIRKTAIKAFYPGGRGTDTVIEFQDTESVVVAESFDQVCNVLGVNP